MRRYSCSDSSRSSGAYGILSNLHTAIFMIRIWIKDREFSIFILRYPTAIMGHLDNKKVPLVLHKKGSSCYAVPDLEQALVMKPNYKV
jgi:hypothetical protein